MIVVMIVPENVSENDHKNVPENVSENDPKNVPENVSENVHVPNGS